MSNLTTTQAAELLHMTPDNVRRMIRRGDLVASYVGRQWLITEDAVAELLESTSSREKRTTRRRRRRAA